MLLALAAAFDLLAYEGTTALSLAEKLQYAEIAALLKSAPSHGAESKTPETKPPVSPSPENKPPQAKIVTPPASSAPPASVSTAKPVPPAVHSGPVAAATPAVDKKSKAQAFYRMGLSMRTVEDLWPQSGPAAERAAASILDDLTKLGAPDDLMGIAQQASARLAAPPEERKGSVPTLISDLRKRLDSYCLTQSGAQIFNNWGGVIYEMSLLGQELSKPGHDETKTEETRKKILPLAKNMAAQCAGITQCKLRALSYVTDTSNLLQQSPLLASNGATLQRLCDQIGVALGTDEPLSSR